MKFLKACTLLTLLLVNPFAFPISSKAADKTDQQSYMNFIMEIGNKVIQILVNKSAPLSQRQEEFREVIHQYFDMPAVSKFVLGRYWHQATETQRQEYLKLFEDAIVESYSQQFENYHNEKLQVESTRDSTRGGTIVTSKIIRSGGTPPLQVDWKVYPTKKGLRIVDVVVNGVSMSITYRTEYANAYNASGGTMEGLLQAMRSKALAPLPVSSTEKQ
jgi:phospholipid transport system substrate-binding protein